MQFSSFELHARLQSNIQAVGYTTPTPIQEQSIPHVLEGRDLMGLAQTGTGKTAAFMLPILHRLMGRPAIRKGATRVLIIAPTRELAEQIYETARDLGQRTGIRCATIYGGVGATPQARALKNGTECIVACPGRLLDHIRQGNADFSGLETLVLDEADHMFDMGFLPDLRKIMAVLPRKRQTLLFSATMPSDVRHLAEEALQNPVRVEIGHAKPVETVSHDVYPVPAHLKTKLLLALLHRSDDGSALVFTRTKHKARQLTEHLLKAGIKAASLQGNLSQNKRQAALKGFRDGDYKVLVATDIAARGIDVSRVNHVFNYDLPDSTDAYTHRIGRTGRAERTGKAHNLITREDTSMVASLERLLGEPMRRLTLEDFDYRAPAPVGVSQEQRPAPGARSGIRRSEPGRSNPAGPRNAPRSRREETFTPERKRPGYSRAARA